jgi:hypothetical protein
MNNGRLFIGTHLRALGWSLQPMRLVTKVFIPDTEFNSGFTLLRSTSHDQLKEGQNNNVSQLQIPSLYPKSWFPDIEFNYTFLTIQFDKLHFVVLQGQLANTFLPF